MTRNSFAAGVIVGLVIGASLGIIVLGGAAFVALLNP